MDTYGHLFEGADQESAAKMEKLLAPARSNREGKASRVLQLAARKAS